MNSDAMQLIEALAPRHDRLVFVPQVGPKARVSSVEDAARKWNEYRARSGAGVSELGNGGTVYGTIGGRGFHVLARISYNGRVERVA